ARWIAEGLPRGEYLVEYYAIYDNYPADARYEVICKDGVHNLIVDMNYKIGDWHSLGTFHIDRVCVVTVSDFWEGVGVKLAVDALRFTLLSELSTSPTTAIPPHIGICIDDCGSVDPTSPSQPIYKMLRLPFKMTYAVMPQLKYTNITAEEIAKLGSEVILHQPMQAITFANPGSGGIIDSMTLKQVRSTISTNLDSIAHCAGMNNHMGSLITQQPDKMQVCLEELKKRNMYFFDSRTITTTVGYLLAQHNGLIAGQRDIFIDAAGDKIKAKALIRNLALRALHAPHVPHLAIGHCTYQGTADALKEIAPELAAMGVEVWTLSRCLSHIVEADFQPAGSSFEMQGAWSQNPNNRYSKELRDGFSAMLFNCAASSNDKAVFAPNLPHDGMFDLYATWAPDDSATSQALVTVSTPYVLKSVILDESISPCDWAYLGRFPFTAGDNNSIIFDNSLCNIPDKNLWADAVKLIYAAPLPGSQTWIFY
ncbi:MAG TPA: divergent polysaccharide deacetylase family protein, partial [Candidatus Sumerlaeia bacterium]|nr:divergent polysaccharide deacetylase family protein [Candidatus Sumerlaeia bacterium]